MLAIEVNFLTGRFVATAHHDRRITEWPPHPARFFSALVATWADANHPDPTERGVLEWLEKQPPPAIHAPEAVARKVVTQFVPVNDAAVISRSPYVNRYKKITGHLEELGGIDRSNPMGQRSLNTLNKQIDKQRDVGGLISPGGKTSVESAINLLPPGWLTGSRARTGQGREYPSVTPADPRITYLWGNRPPSGMEEPLDQLLARVTRLGHSSSLVSCRLQNDPPSPSHIPGAGGTVMRTVRTGQLMALERAHARHQASRPRSLPFVSTAYRSIAEESSGGVTHLRPDTAGELLIFEFGPESRSLPSTRVAELTSVLRDSVFHYAQDPLPEGLSGHQTGGSPSTRPHVGFLGLPWVEQQHSDGRLMGLAISIPHSLDHAARRALLRAVGTWEDQAGNSGSSLKLTLGRRGVLNLHRVVSVSDLITLRPHVWKRAARRWVSVTPIALPRHPGPLGKGTAAARAKAWKRAEQAVMDACSHVNLPEPVQVDMALQPLMPGVRPAGQYPAFRQGLQRGEPVARRLLHASVTFERPVEGPLVLGAGRYLGLGLLRPVRRASKS